MFWKAATGLAVLSGGLDIVFIIEMRYECITNTICKILGMGVCLGQWFLHYFSGFTRFVNHGPLVIKRYNSFTKTTASVLYCWRFFIVQCRILRVSAWVVVYFPSDCSRSLHTV